MTDKQPKITRHKLRAVFIRFAVIALSVAADGGVDTLTIIAGLLGCAAAGAVSWWDYTVDVQETRQAELNRRRHGA